MEDIILFVELTYSILIQMGLRYKSRVEFWFEVQLPASFSPLQFLLVLLLPTSTTPLFYDPIYVQMNGRQVPRLMYLG